MNMKAIFFGNQKEDLLRVYAADTKKRIEGMTGASPALYSAEDLGKVDFTDVKYLFTTWGMAALSEAEIKQYFPALECVFYAAGSVQNFARPFLKCGVKVFSSWKANAVPVIEYALAQIILASKGFYRLARMTKESYLNAAQELQNYPGNYNTNVGILGDGAIGGEVIKRLKRDYKLNVYVYSITMSRERAEELGVRLSSLEEIFSECSVISNHLANNEKTQGIINSALLNKMQPYTTFINTGRGAQVDEAALTSVLERDSTVTAVLDVTNPEPPAAGSKLYSLPNVILTPHIAGSSGNEVQRMAEYMADEAERYLKGEALLYEVTEKMLELMA